MEEKINYSMKLIKKSVEEFGDNIAVACSWGKDSMVLLDMALKVKPNIPVFSILTIHKPKETFSYVVEVSKKYKFQPKIFMVAEEIPDIINNMNVTLLSSEDYRINYEGTQNELGTDLFYNNPKLC